jgi:hypothetical protein
MVAEAFGRFGHVSEYLDRLERSKNEIMGFPDELLALACALGGQHKPSGASRRNIDIAITSRSLQSPRPQRGRNIIPYSSVGLLIASQRMHGGANDWYAYLAPIRRRRNSPRLLANRIRRRLDRNFG